MDKYVKIGKRISYLLRHNNEDLQMDANGYVSVNDLILKLNITQEELEYIVINNNKKRYFYDDTKTKIRAAQGHSLPVNTGLIPVIPPSKLYHGTSQSNYSKIVNGNGIEKMSRLHVHLSEDKSTAYDVGKRHAKDGEPLLIEIDAASMHANGYIFYLSENHVWLTDNVPSKYFVN